MPSKTYYYKVYACATNKYFENHTGQSKLSNEVSFTADDTNRSVKLDWSACSGAGYYNVFVTDVSGDYTPAHAKKFYCVSGPAGIGTARYPTTNQTTFTDDGTISKEARHEFVCGKSTDEYPCGFEPFNDGIACLAITGGTSDDPITPQNIYDAAVTQGYTNYCYWDKTTFGLNAFFQLESSIETHFKMAGGSIITISGWNINLTHSNSNFQLGEKSSSGLVYSGIFLGRMGDFSYFYLRDGFKFYDTKIQDISPRYSGNSIVASYNGITHWLYGDRGEIVGCDAARIFNYEDNVIEDVRTTTGNFETYAKTLLQYNCKGDYYRAYGATGYIEDRPYLRTDSFTALNKTYQFYFRTFVNTELDDYIIKVIDFNAPNSTDIDKLPIVYSPNTVEAKLAKCFLKTYNSFLLKIVDEADNPISGVSVIVNTSGGYALDYSGDNMSFITNNAGYIAYEQITITGVSNNSITDSSKSWTTNKWQGRNIYIFNGNGKQQKMKVKSNTATTLTFTNNFAINPSAGDLAGVIPEIFTSIISHIAGTGAGYGPNH